MLSISHKQRNNKCQLLYCQDYVLFYLKRKSNSFIFPWAEHSENRLKYVTKTNRTFYAVKREESKYFAENCPKKLSQHNIVAHLHCLIKTIILLWLKIVPLRQISWNVNPCRTNEIKCIKMFHICIEFT